MNKLIKNPLFWVGAVIGVRWLYANKPDSKLTKIFEEIEEGATNLAYQTADYATNVIDTGVEVVEDSASVLGWNMEDGDDDPGQDLDAGVDSTGGDLDVINGTDTSDIPSDDEGGIGFDSSGGSVKFSGDELPDDDINKGFNVISRKDPLAPTHNKYIDFSSSEQGDLDVRGVNPSKGAIISEWDEQDPEGSGTTNTGWTGAKSFTPESQVDTARDDVNFGAQSQVSYNDFDY